MKRNLPLLALLPLLAGCATLGPLPEADLDARAEALLGEGGAVEALELSLVTDLVDQRLVLVRPIIVTTEGKKTRSLEVDDVSLGLYFGNGLFLDDNGVLCLLLDRLAGIKRGFVGSTTFLTHAESFLNGVDPSDVELTATYDQDTVTVEKPKIYGVFEQKYGVSFDATSIEIDNAKVSLRSDGSVRLTPILPLPLSTITWKPIGGGYERSSWTKFGLVPYIKTNNYLLADGRIVDKEKTILVENRGSYLRFAYTKGDKYAFRLYRSPGKILVQNESSGLSCLIEQNSAGLFWKKEAAPGLLKPSKKVLDYSLTIRPATP